MFVNTFNLLMLTPDIEESTSDCVMCIFVDLALPSMQCSLDFGVACLDTQLLVQCRSLQITCNALFCLNVVLEWEFPCSGVSALHLLTTAQFQQCAVPFVYAYFVIACNQDCLFAK